MKQKTAHEFARELLALPDLPLFHFDPSFSDACDDETDATIGTPTASVVNPREGLTEEEIAEMKGRGFCLCDFITIDGDQPQDSDRRELSWAEMMVVGERQRQKQAEGYDDAHDDKHNRAELAEAAMCYLQAEIGQVRSGLGIVQPFPPPRWPWNAEDWKPDGDPRRTLIKAAALILAEIERLERLGEAKKGEA